MDKPKETKKKKKLLTPETRRALSPLLLLQKSLTPDLSDETVTLSQDQVKEKCFEVLGLMEEYFIEPATAVDVERTQSRFEGADELNDYLKLLDEEEQDQGPDLLNAEASAQSSELQIDNPSKGELVKRHRDLIKSRIRQLLASPQVRDLLRSELSKELLKFKKARLKLQRLQRVKRAIERATLDMHGTYLESKKKHHGVLVESAGKKIERLSKIVNEAEKEEKQTVTDANKVERGFIVTQELLAYKRQMIEKGFALTPSRVALLQKIVEHSMSGQKVFLVGSTGTGKTELAFYAVNEVTGEYEIIPWHEGTVMKDVLGQMQLTQNTQGQVESSFKPGPLVRGYTKGRGVIHEEITAGSTRTMMGMKPYLNLRPGQPFKIPEMNGTILRVDQEILMEIFTGNPKSEQTSEREDLDPAILRMMKGIQVEYMPAAEMAKIIIAKLMEESGLLKLSRSDVELIEKLAEAAHLMQMSHENTLEGEAAAALKQACGIDDLRITKNFLDPGSFLGLFAKYDYERRKGKSLRVYLQEQLDEFLHDPKTINVPEERTLALGILKLNGVLDTGSTLAQVKVAAKDLKFAKEKPYILPSEMGFFLEATPLLEDDPLAESAGEDTNIEKVIEKVRNELKEMLGATANSTPASASAKKKAKVKPAPARANRSGLSDIWPEIDFFKTVPFSVEKTLMNEQLNKKLKEMCQGYNESIATAKEMDPTVRIKPIEEVMTAILTLGPAILKEIANFGQPTLLVVPKNPFAEKIDAMNSNRKYKNQAKTDVDNKTNSPFQPVYTSAKTIISIVDGAQHMPHITGIALDSRYDERKRKFKEHYSSKGLRLITAYEYAILMQRSLRDYQKNGEDVNKIVDFYQSKGDTVTCLDDECLTGSSFVAFAYFRTGDNRVCFNADDPASVSARLRGRPSAQVLEY